MSNNVREATDRLLEMAEENEESQYNIILACVKYMSEDQVADMCRINEFFDIEADTEAEEIEDFLSNYDASDYDTEAMRIDIENGNFDIHSDDPEKYYHDNIIWDSFENGQFTQAKQQCESFDVNYDEQLAAFRQQQA